MNPYMCCSSCVSSKYTRQPPLLVQVHTSLTVEVKMGFSCKRLGLVMFLVVVLSRSLICLTLDTVESVHKDIISQKHKT